MKSIESSGSMVYEVDWVLRVNGIYKVYEVNGSTGSMESMKFTGL